MVEPIVDDRGRHRFVIDDLETIKQSLEVTRFRRTPDGASSGALAHQPQQYVDRAMNTAVLDLLDNAVRPVEIAKKLNLLPHELDPIVKWWTANHGGYFVSEEQADDVWMHFALYAKRRGPSQKPKTASDLVELASDIAEKVQHLESDVHAAKSCKHCRREPSMYCPKCAQRKFGKADDD